MSILLAVLVTDPHNTESLYAALPAGTTVTTLVLSEDEWALRPEQMASRYLVAMSARTRQAWLEGRAV